MNEFFDSARNAQHVTSAAEAKLSTKDSSPNPIAMLRSLRLGTAAVSHIDSNVFDSWSEAQVGAVSAFITSDGVPSRLPQAQIDAVGLRAQKVGRSLQSVRNFCHTYSTATADWTGFARHVALGSLDDFTLGAWLMSVTLSGLDEDTTRALTKAMASSGDRHDYRPEVNGRLLRRYPTGALSEKIALIMPVVLLYLREVHNLNLNSPFLIARALGHTGGTRDKLSAINGFRLPEAGSETIAMLREIGVCYVATSGLFNPADDRLYSLRSITNTIESAPLIVASIASKMLACPVDLMQLDTRWGEGAFFGSREAARQTAHNICRAISVDGQQAFATITEAHHPDGSTLGAIAEVAEAITCLRSLNSLFDYRGISYQQRLVADFTARLVGELFSKSISDVYTDVLRAFADGSFQAPFLKLMTAHGVSEAYARALWDDPALELRKLRMTRIVSPRDGRLQRLNQVALGEFLREHFRDWSLVLHGRPGDFLRAGDPLFDLYVPPESDEMPVPDADWATMET